MSEERDTPTDPSEPNPEMAEPLTPRVPTPSPPPVTKPTPQRLQDTRREPTWVPELSGSAPTRLTPPAPVATAIGTLPPRPGPVPSVLIVDDERDLRESLKMALEDEGYVVQTAENGVEGLRSLGQMLTGDSARHHGAACDVVILDLEMPKLTGFDVLSIVQAWTCLDWLPVIILSGKPRPVDQDLPEEFVFIRKGDDPAALLATVRKFADISRARRTP